MWDKPDVKVTAGNVTPFCNGSTIITCAVVVPPIAPAVSGSPVAVLPLVLLS